jgi:hypothetical protein
MMIFIDGLKLDCCKTLIICRVKIIGVLQNLIPFFFYPCDLTKFFKRPVRTRFRIGPLHRLACRKRRLNGAVLRIIPEKPRPRVTAGVAR